MPVPSTTVPPRMRRSSLMTFSDRAKDPDRSVATLRRTLQRPAAWPSGRRAVADRVDGTVAAADVEPAGGEDRRRLERVWELAPPEVGAVPVERDQALVERQVDVAAHVDDRRVVV